MGEVHLDHPGEWSWFHECGPLPIKGSCPHTSCSHWCVATIAYGPDWDHYELAQCNDTDGCNGRCRGWVRAYPKEYAYRNKLPRITWPQDHLGWVEVERNTASIGQASG